MKILIPIKVYQKLISYVENIDYEISGLGKISINKNEITVEDVRIFKQVVSSGETELDRDELTAFYDEIIKEEGDLSKWKLWWHSHATFDVFFSSTDLKTIEDFDNEMHSDNWMLSIVTNHKKELLARVDIFYPIRCVLNDVSWEIIFDDRDIAYDVTSEIYEKVSIRKVIPKSTKGILDLKSTIIGPDGRLKHSGKSFSDISIDELLCPTKPIEGEIIK